MAKENFSDQRFTITSSADSSGNERYNGDITGTVKKSAGKHRTNSILKGKIIVCKSVGIRGVHDRVCGGRFDKNHCRCDVTLIKMMMCKLMI